MCSLSGHKSFHFIYFFEVHWPSRWTFDVTFLRVGDSLGVCGLFVIPLLNCRREPALWQGLCSEWQEPAEWPQAVGELARLLLHVSPLPPPFFQPPSASTGLCMTPAVRDASRPATTGMRLARAISRAWQVATVQQTWSFTGGGASSQSFVLSGDPCSAA